MNIGASLGAGVFLQLKTLQVLNTICFVQLVCVDEDSGSWSALLLLRVMQLSDCWGLLNISLYSTDHLSLLPLWTVEHKVKRGNFAIPPPGPDLSQQLQLSTKWMENSSFRKYIFLVFKVTYCSRWGPRSRPPRPPAGGSPACPPGSSLAATPP